MELTPAAERRLLLKDLALAELDLGHLRKLPPEEARWRIEHEYKVQVAWAERRRNFMLADCVKPSKAPRGTTGKGVVVVRHSTVGANGIVGERRG